MTSLLVESTAVPVPTEKEGRWRAVLLTPGKGSSGTYSEAVLREYGSVALKKGSKSFVTHNRTENGEPDPFSMWGFLAEDAVYEEGVGLVGEIEVLPSWREKIAEVAPHTALSIYVMGESDKDGNVTALLEDVQNGVDLVVYPGRPGSGLVEKLYESMKTSADEAENGAAPAGRRTEEKESSMDIEEIGKKVDALAESVSAFIAQATPLLENLKPAETPDEVDIATVVESVVDANLPKGSRKVVLEAIKNGGAIEDAIKEEKARVDEIRKELSESVKGGQVTGRVVEAGGTQFSLKGLVGA
jgi:hypothetical protein